MKTIYVFGNPLSEADSLAIKVAEELKKKTKNFVFRFADSLEEVEEKNLEELIVLDVAQRVKKVEVVEKIEELETFNPVSLHDFDIATQLKLFKKIGKLKKVKIIAVPINYNLKQAISEVERVISTLP